MTSNNIQVFRHNGSALISALFLMTLITIAATAMSMRLRFDIYRTQLTLNNSNLHLAAQLVRFWAMSELTNENKHFYQADSNGVVAHFPTRFAHIYPNIEIEGTLIDLQSRVNINNFAQPRYLNWLHHILNSPQWRLDTPQQRELLFSLFQWLTPYQPEQGQTPLESYYLSQKSPYLPAHQKMQSVSELILIKGNTPALQTLLTPLFYALPDITPLNINTAPKSLLKILLPNITATQINQLMEIRQQGGFQEAQKLQAFLNKLPIQPDMFAIESQYFMSIARVRLSDLDHQELMVYTVLKRNSSHGNRAAVRLIQETLNTI